MYQFLGDFGKAETYQKDSLVISKVKEGEALSYGNLGSLFRSLGKYEYHEKALTVSREIGYIDGEATLHLNLASTSYLKKK